MKMYVNYNDYYLLDSLEKTYNLYDVENTELVYEWYDDEE